MKKRILIVLLLIAAAIAIAFVSCSSSDDTAASGDGTGTPKSGQATCHAHLTLTGSVEATYDGPLLHFTGAGSGPVWDTSSDLPAGSVVTNVDLSAETNLTDWVDTDFEVHGDRYNWTSHPQTGITTDGNDVTLTGLHLAADFGRKTAVATGTVRCP